MTHLRARFVAPQVANAALEIFPYVNQWCGNILQTLSPCLSEMPVQKGCCSSNCIKAMQQISALCHKRLQELVCSNEDLYPYVFGVDERCLGIKPSCTLLALSSKDNRNVSAVSIDTSVSEAG